MNKKPTKASSSTGSNKKWIVIAFLLLLLIGGTVWALWTPGKDPQVAKIDELRAQLEAANGDQRRDLWGQMREEMDKLSPEAREQMRDERRKQWQEREQKWMNEFFNMSYAEQIAAIDKQIDDREKRRQRWEQRQAGQGGPNGQGGPRADGSGGGRDGPGGRGDGMGGGGGRGGRSTDSVERRKNYLNHTTPLQRAQRSAYREMVQQRRSQRGMGG